MSKLQQPRTSFSQDDPATPQVEGLSAISPVPDAGHVFDGGELSARIAGVEHPPPSVRVPALPSTHQHLSNNLLGTVKSLAIRALLSMLPRLLALITPKVKAALKDLLDRAKKKARTTDTALDDAFVDTLQIALVGGDPEDLLEGMGDGWLGLFRSIGPELRELVETGVLQLEELADTTPNKFDDMAVSILKGALGLKQNSGVPGQSSEQE